VKLSLLGTGRISRNGNKQEGAQPEEMFSVGREQVDSLHHYEY
jgi:hypothetical protein